MISFFDSVEQLPEDPILHLATLFAEERNSNKVNLGIGSYKDAEGRPAVLQCVRKAEEQIFQQNLNKEYPPIEGVRNLLDAAKNLIFGLQQDLPIITVQTIGGCGALRVGAEFLYRNHIHDIFIPEPTWPNHRLVFESARLRVHSYPYYDTHIHGLKFEAICASIDAMPKRSVILLHASCHNPTGFEPSRAQWRELLDRIQQREILPFFDLAYQGLGDGLDQDAASIREFLDQRQEMLVANSFSKNLGLYGERVGTLSAVVKDSKANAILSHFKKITRSLYSMAPLHGGRVVSTILNSEDLKQEWIQELTAMRERIGKMRILLAEALKAKGVKRDLSFLKQQKGMFSFMGLQHDQVVQLRNQYGIYVTDNGRLNISGLTMQNIDYVSDALAMILR